MEKERELREDFRRRVERNFQRLSGDTYAGEKVFREPSYDWPGDWEGRYLLAGVLLRRLTGRETAALSHLIAHLEEHTNEFGYFGKAIDGTTVSEQQLSGNGWFLRGLCEYYADRPALSVRERIGSIVENLYLKCADLYARYPVSGARAQGGVSGSTVGETADGNFRQTSAVRSLHSTGLRRRMPCFRRRGSKILSTGVYGYFYL